MTTVELAEAPRLGTTYRSRLLPHLGTPMATAGVALDVGGRSGAWLRQCEASTRVVVDLEVQPGVSVSGIGGSGLDLPIRDGAAELTFALDVIEHVADDAVFLRELHRTLADGGTLTLTTPDHRIRVFPGFLQPWVDRRWGHDRVRGYERTALLSMLRSAGFTDVEVRSIGMRAYRWTYLPLRVLSGVSSKMGMQAAGLCAALDALRPDGDRGFLLATATR